MSRLSMPPVNDLPVELRRELTQLDLRLRWVEFARGCGSLLFVVLLLSALFLGIDLFYPLSGAIRFCMLIVLATTVLWLGYQWLVTPLARRREWPELAFLIDRSFPDLQERVSSTVELSLVPEEVRGLASEFMRQRLRQETDKKLATIDLWECLSLGSMALALVAGTLIALLAAVPLMFDSGSYSLLWQRLLTPWANLESATNLTFVVDEGDRTIPRGEDLVIQARPEWRFREETLPREIRLNWSTRNGQAASRAMSYDSRRGVYVGKIAQVTEPLQYELSSRQSRSRVYRVDVADRPRILDATLTVEPPEYTHHKPTEHEGAMGTIRAIQGSRLIARLRFEHPVAEAAWVWSTSRITRPGEEASANSSNGRNTPSNNSRSSDEEIPLGQRPTTIPAAISSDGYSAVVEVRADQSDSFQFRVVSAAGLRNQNEPQRVIQVIPDRPPRVEILGETEPMKVRADEIVPIEVLADDDFGVMELQIVVENLTAGKKPTTLPEWTSAKTGPTERLVQDRYELNLAPLNLKNGDILGYRAVARDGRPDPRPNEVWTPRHVLLISQDVKSLAGQEVEEFYEAVRRQAENVRNEVAGHRKEMERHRGDLDPKPREDAQARLQENKADWLQKKLSLSLQIDDLSRKLQQRPITQALSRMNAEPARELLEQAAERLEQFEREQQSRQADPLETIRADETSLREAEGLLSRLVNQLRDAERIEQELTELQRLARRARELAQQAAQLEEQASPQRDAKPAADKDPKNGTTAPETAQEPTAPPAELGEKSPDTPAEAPPEQPQVAPLDQLEQEYSALSHDLDQLLNRRPELKQAAKNALLTNLGEASDLAGDLAELQAQLTESLEQARADQREGQQALAAELMETFDLAAELAARSERESARQASPVFNAAPTGQALEQQREANRGKATRALQQAREALQRFSQERTDRAPLPTDIAQATRTLAEQTRDLQAQAEELAQARKALNQELKKAEETARREKRALTPREQAQFTEQNEELTAARDRIGEQLSGLMQAIADLETPPAQKHLQPDALDALDRANDELAKQSDQAAARLRDAAKHLDNLAQKVGTLEERQQRAAQPLKSLQEQTEQLRKQLQEQQEKAAAGEQVDPNLLKEFANRQRDQAHQLLRQDTLDQEEKVVAAAEAAQRAIEAMQEGKLPQAAEAQQTFSEQLNELRQALEQGESPPAERASQRELWKEAEVPEELRKVRFPQREDQTPDLAEQLQKIARQQAELTEKTAALAEEQAEPQQEAQRKEQLRQLADQQRQLAEQAEQLRGKDAALPRMQAQQALRDAAEALRQGDQPQAAELQRQASRGLEQATRQTQATPPEKESPSIEQLSAALERKLTELDRQLAASARKAESTPVDPDQAQPADQAPPQPADAPDQPTKSQEEDIRLQRQLADLREQETLISEQSAQLAQLAKTTVPDKEELAQPLEQAAEQAGKAARDMTTGQLSRAQQQAEEAARSLQQAADQPGLPEAAQAATEQLATRQQELSAQLRELADNPRAAELAQQALQRELNQQAERLTQSLDKLASDSQAKPIDDRHNGEQVGQLGRQSEQTADQMQRALQESEQGNLRESARNSRQASQQLQELAQRAAKLADMKRDTLVPEPVGAEAADASRQLAQARESLKQARQQAQEQEMAQAEGQPADQADSENSGQADGQPAGDSTPTPGEASQADNAGSPESQQPGSEGQASGEMKPSAQPADSAMQQLAKELAQAAQALQQAHKNLQPPDQDSQKPPSQQQQAPDIANAGQPNDGSDSTSGNQADLGPDGAPLGSARRSVIMRDWGKRQGDLETDLTDARRRLVDQEYAPLIQRYLESLARPAEGDTER